MKFFNEYTLDAIVFLAQVFVLWKAPAVISRKLKKLSGAGINQMPRHELESDIFIIGLAAAAFAFMCKIVLFDRIGYTVKTLFVLLG